MGEDTKLLALADQTLWVTALIAAPVLVAALAVGLMVAALSAILSCFVVLKGWSLMGDAVSHAILPGVAYSSQREDAVPEPDEGDDDE